ncbi:MAG: proton-conducting transporter membrane subunit, partial [Phycisphaerales bacterium]
MDALAIASLALLAWQAARPEPVDVVGLRIDRATALFGLLVAGIGAVTMRYSLRSLAGDPARERFAVRMAVATGAAWISATANLLPMLVGAWIVQAIALHGLLTIRHDRPQAVLPARTAFAIGRVGDLLLVTAFALAWRDWGAVRVSEIVTTASDAADPATLAPVAVLLALGAAAKSAQVPMHAWLPETMEAPTP